MPYFKRDGLNFYFEQRGFGQPFVFSHGLGGNVNRAWELVEGLPGLQVTIYDNRDHGRTHPLCDPAKLNFQEMADDMAALLDHLSIPKAVVGGVSMGAAIALSFGLRHTAAARGLIISRPAWVHHGNPPGLAFTKGFADLVRLYGPEQGISKFRDTDFYKELLQCYPDTDKTVTETFAEWSPEALIACYEAIPASSPVDSLASLRGLNLPILIVANRKDPVHPFEFAEALAQALPQAQLQEIIPKSDDANGHTRQFRQCVTEFVAQLG